MPHVTNVRWIKRIFKTYSLVGSSLAVIAFSYVLLLNFPQPLFAYSTSYERFTVYSRGPIPAEIEKVLDTAEAKLKTSPIYDERVRRSIYLTNGFPMYALLSHKAYNSFANSVPFINNVFINKTDVPADLVFVNRAQHNQRSLSGVVAHEVTHLFIRQRYGPLRSMLMPTWKNEGYCEYVAGESTISLDEGLRLWRENPTDDISYRYIKYHAMVKYLLENEHMSVDELMTQDLDENDVAANTYAALVRGGGSF